MSSTSLTNIPFQNIIDAKTRTQDIGKSPIVPLNHEWPDGKIYLKLENLHPIGSFKLRGAYNAVSALSEKQRQAGVYTASAGNFAQGLAWSARKFGIPCTTIVPDEAPDTKIQAIRQLGADIVKLPYDEFWDVILSHSYERVAGTFIHPVANPDVIAGNGVIGLEIIEDFPDVDTILVPYGGGALSTGIASAVRESNPNVRVIACEVETAAPLSASLKAGKIQTCDSIASFVDGIGGKSVLEEMWPLVQRLIHDSIVVSLRDIAQAIKLIAEKNHVIAEGAAAATLAAALSGKAGGGNITCIVSGGNIDTKHLVTILSGGVPN